MIKWIRIIDIVHLVTSLSPLKVLAPKKRKNLIFIYQLKLNSICEIWIHHG